MTESQSQPDDYTKLLEQQLLTITVDGRGILSPIQGALALLIDDEHDDVKISEADKSELLSVSLKSIQRYFELIETLRSERLDLNPDTVNE